MKKTSMKIVLIAAALVLALVCLTACGGGDSSSDKKEDTAAAASFDGTKYVYEGNEVSLKKADIPESYKLVPYDQFAAAFKAITVDGTITTESTYEDVARLFGDDGLKVAGLVYEGYAYYTWYSDKDSGSDKVADVSITFKDDGKKLTYYAWSSSTIKPDDVK